MPPRRAANVSKQHEPLSSEEKIARLMGLLLIKDVENKIDQVTLLKTAGFQNAEVASMLNMTENHVKVATFAGKKKQSKKKAKT